MIPDAAGGIRGDRSSAAGNLDFVDQMPHARHTPTAVQAELLLVKRVDRTAEGHRAVVCFDFDPSQGGYLPSEQIIGHAAFEVSIVVVNERVVKANHEASSESFRLLPGMDHAAKAALLGCTAIGIPRSTPILGGKHLI
jgi:hypothetical protein